MTETSWTSTYSFYLVAVSHLTDTTLWILGCNEYSDFLGYLWHRAGHLWLESSDNTVNACSHTCTQMHTLTLHLQWDYWRPVHAMVSLGYLQYRQDNDDTSLFPRVTLPCALHFRWRHWKDVMMSKSSVNIINMVLICLLPILSDGVIKRVQFLQCSVQIQKQLHTTDIFQKCMTEMLKKLSKLTIGTSILDL